jgi:hypothetical protein
MQSILIVVRLVIGLSMVAVGTLLAGANLNLLWEGFTGVIMLAFLVVFIYIGCRILPSNDSLRKLISRRKD